MGSTFIKLGREGEQIVCEALEKQGHEITAANVNTRFGEIDIIAKKYNHYLFVEVKTRRSFKFGRGDEAVNYYKLKHFKMSVQRWVSLHNYKGEIRLKAAVVHLSETQPPKITWMRID